MKKTELVAKTVAELKALAKKKKISLPSGAKKDDVIKALMASGARTRVERRWHRKKRQHREKRQYRSVLHGAQEFRGLL
jgi:hypothetical protein